MCSKSLFSKSTEIYFLFCYNRLFYFSKGSKHFRISFFSFCLRYLFGWCLFFVILRWFLLFRGVYLILQSFDYLTFSAALRSPHRKKIQSILFLLLLLNLNFLPALFSKSTEIYFLFCFNWLFYFSKGSKHFRISFFSFCLRYLFGWCLFFVILRWFLLFRGVYLILQSFDYLTFSAALRSGCRKKIQSILFFLFFLRLNQIHLL